MHRPQCSRSTLCMRAGSTATPRCRRQSIMMIRFLSRRPTGAANWWPRASSLPEEARRFLASRHRTGLPSINATPGVRASHQPNNGATLIRNPVRHHPRQAPRGCHIGEWSPRQVAGLNLSRCHLIAHLNTVSWRLQLGASAPARSGPSAGSIVYLLVRRQLATKCTPHLVVVHLAGDKIA